MLARLPRLAVSAFACTLLSSAPSTASAADPPPFAPRYADATVELAGRTVRAAGVRSPWSPAHRVGGLAGPRVAVRDAIVEDADAKAGPPAWSVPAPDARNLRWLCAAGQIVLVAPYPLPAPQGQPPASADPGAPEVRRFDVATRAWIAPLTLPADKAVPRQADVVVDAIADPAGRVAVLTQQSVPVDEDRSWKPTGFRLTTFAPGKTDPTWSLKLPATGADRPEPGVRLLAARMPDYAVSDVRHLSWTANGGVLVCPGERDDLTAVTPDGKVDWAVSRVWEFERGFVGPSVWSHYVARFGDDKIHEGRGQPDTPEDAKALAARRADFDKRFVCAIVGGPVIVTTRGGDQDRSPAERVLVAVSKAPHAWNHGYLAECVVYVLSGGRVEERVTLPRMVLGNRMAETGDAVVWACQTGSLVRLPGVPAEGVRGGWSAGPGGPDLVASVDWYKRLPTPRLDGWLVADKARDAVAFSATRAARAVAGGFVAAQADRVYQFPLSFVDLKTGDETAAVLRVPFDGQLAPPTTNKFTDGRGFTRTQGAYLLGVTQLALDGETLEVTLGTENGATGVRFDLTGAR